VSVDTGAARPESGTRASEEKEEGRESMAAVRSRGAHDVSEEEREAVSGCLLSHIAVTVLSDPSTFPVERDGEYSWSSTLLTGVAGDGAEGEETVANPEVR